MTRPVREAALGILIRVDRDAAHAAPLLDRRADDVPPKDRDLLRVLVKSTLRHAIRLDHVLARNAARPIAELDVEVRAALRLGAAQLLVLDRVPPHAAVSETVAALKTVAPRGTGFVNAVLRRVASAEARSGRVALPPDADAAERLAVETAHPTWLVRRWSARLGEEVTRGVLVADNEDARLDLLVDPRVAGGDAVESALAEAGVVLATSAWAPAGRVVVSGNAAAHPLVRSGAVAVVDAAAQAICEMVPASRVVLDLAAAPGGKTRTLLARGRARNVVALDPNASRARRLAGNLSAGARRADVLVVRADARRPPLRRNAHEAILLDAPCSGTGTLRKNPEIRLRLREADLGGFAEIQRALLESALDLAAPGGVVVYATCSLEPEENEEVAAAVLARRGDAAIERPREADLPRPLAGCLRSDGWVRVVPSGETDGFSAVMIRRSRQVR